MDPMSDERASTRPNVVAPEGLWPEAKSQMKKLTHTIKIGSF